MAEPKSIAEARKQGKSYFIGKDGKRKAAVTKEDMKKAGFKSFGKESLRRYLMGMGPKKSEPGVMSEPMGMAKKGGQVRKAKKGGQVYNRKNGGDLMVASSYKGF